MAKKTSSKRGPVTPKNKKSTKDQAEPRKLPAAKSMPRAKVKDGKAAKAAPRGKVLSKRILEDAITAILSSPLSVASPRLNQIAANLENRLEGKVPPDKLIEVLTSLENDGKVVRHYSWADVVATGREKPRKMVNPPARTKVPKLIRSSLSMTASLPDDKTSESADDDDFNLKDGVRVVLCNQPQGPLSPDQILQRLNDFFGITFDLVPVTDALEDLASLPDGDPRKITRSRDDLYSRQCP